MTAGAVRPVTVIASDQPDAAAPRSRWGNPERTAAIVSIVAVLFAGLAQLWGPGPALAAGLLLFVCGLAHGAGDEDAQRMAPIGWGRAVAYLIVGFAFAAVFLLAPAVGLTVFLGLSAWHFARAELSAVWPARLAVAMLAIGGSALLRPHETSAVFATILGASPPDALMTCLSLVGGGGILFTGLAVGMALVRLTPATGPGAALVSLGAAAALHPVLAAGLAFFVGHAVPVQLAQIRRYGTTAVRRAVLWPTLVAITGAAGIAFAVLEQWLALPFAAALALGLATPHMLTERLDG